MESPFSVIGPQIRKLRKARGLSQEQLAEAADISTSHLSDIETGRTNFGVDILARIAAALEVPTDVILQTGFPEVSAVSASYGKEIAALLADCTASDAERIVTIVREVKDALASARKEASER